jgi:photosystem II stability/assembly factor-like uncharacterized protein
MTRSRWYVAAFSLVLALACAEDEPPEVSNWYVYRGPTIGGVSLRAIDGVSPSDVWAAGNGGTLMHYDGVGWSFYQVEVTDLDLYGLDMTSGSTGWAVGADGLVLGYHNGQWFNSVHLTGYDLYGVAFRDGFGFVVGDHGSLFAYDGEKWEDVALPGVTADLRDVAFGSDGRAWAVGDVGTVLSYDGARWTKVAGVPTEKRLNAVLVRAAGVYAVGDDGLILRDAGGGWRALSSPTTAPLLDLAATTGTAFACGNDGALLGEKDGVWGVVGLEAGPVNLNGVVLLNDAEGWAVGDGCVILQYRRAWK